MQEMLTDADNFAVTFPKDLCNEAKSTILGAVFLIDFMYFEVNDFGEICWFFGGQLFLQLNIFHDKIRTTNQYNVEEEE